MPIQPFQFDIVWRVFEDGSRLGSVLLFPELSELGKDVSQLRRRLIRNTQKILSGLELREIHRRQPGAPPQLKRVAVQWDPAERDRGEPSRSAWRDPVSLRFDYVAWRHGREAAIVHVPALGVEAVAQEESDLDELVRREILFALGRSAATPMLRELCWLQREGRVELERVSLKVDIKSPKQRSLAERQGTEKSFLKEVGDNFDRLPYEAAFEQETLLERLADYLSGRRPRSLLLTGPSGVGKTALVRELAHCRAKYGLGKAPFWTTSGARIAAGMSGYGMWQQRCQGICREAAKTHAVVHLGNLMELMQVGKSSVSDQSVGDFLRPAIERGDFLAIAECTPEQLALLQRDAAGMLRAFLPVTIPEPGGGEALAILRKSALARGRGATLTEEALETLDRLHRRYATYSAYPGRPLRFLQHLFQENAAAATIGPTEVAQAFSRETGLPSQLLEDGRRLDLEYVRGWFAERVVGQAAAADAVVQVLANVKAGLTPRHRPIASLLFIGPTGVGKTEMAKALAEFLYQDRRRITRIDMSEYAEAAAFDRLIGGAFGADGLLTAKVREQPFGVVLLDEFEKAHPQVFDLLLQVLGDGRLTDASGRLAEFRNTVIIMTSNLGSESYQRAEVGFGVAEGPAERAVEHFSRAVQETLRPELFNRIEKIVPFLPLSKETIERIARRELQLFQQREGVRHRDVQLQVADQLVCQIARLGYEPQYGARPIKRAIERHLAAPLAAALNERSSDLPLTATLDAGASGVRIAVTARSDGGDLTAPESRRAMVRFAEQVSELRRQAFQLRESRAAADLRTEMYRLERSIRERAKTSRRSRVSSEPGIASLEPLKQLIGRLEKLAGDAAATEDLLLGEYYAASQFEPAGFVDELAELQRRSDSLHLELFRRDCDEPDQITLAICGPAAKGGLSASALRLAEGYARLAIARGFHLTTYQLRVGPLVGPESEDRFVLPPVTRTASGLVFPALASGGAEREKGERSARHKRGGGGSGSADSAKRPAPAGRQDLVLVAERIGEDAASLQVAPPEAIAIGLSIQGADARLLLETEAGLHLFRQRAGEQKCLVDARPGTMHWYDPPAEIMKPFGVGRQGLRRLYEEAAERIEDKPLKVSRRWTGKNLEEVLGPLLDQLLAERAREWVYGH